MSARELNLKAEREAFERACPGLNPLRYVDDSAYCSEVVEYHWKGWLAARRADLEILRPDTGSEAKPLAHGHRDDYYLMANAWRIAMRPIYAIRHMQNWVFAKELFATGSTSARQICHDAGIDPDGTRIERLADCGEPTKPEGA